VSILFNLCFSAYCKIICGIWQIYAENFKNSGPLKFKHESDSFVLRTPRDRSNTMQVTDRGPRQMADTQNFAINLEKKSAVVFRFGAVRDVSMKTETVAVGCYLLQRVRTVVRTPQHDRTNATGHHNIT
jgi:hypothetical protein